MVRERIKEVVDFATGTSPYKNANKGWLTEDVYLELGASSNKESKIGKEFIDVLVFWEPISRLLYLLFFVFALSAILVVSTISFSKGSLDISIGLPQIQTVINEPIVFEDSEGIKEDVLSIDTIKVNEPEEFEPIAPNISIDQEDVGSEIEDPIDNSLKINPKKTNGTAGNLF